MTSCWPSSNSGQVYLPASKVLTCFGNNLDCREKARKFEVYICMKLLFSFPVGSHRRCYYYLLCLIRLGKTREIQTETLRAQQLLDSAWSNKNCSSCYDYDYSTLIIITSDRIAWELSGPRLGGTFFTQLAFCINNTVQEGN